MTTTIHRNTDALTGITTVVDSRYVTACRAEQLARVRADCGAAIIAAAPEYKQRNAALGLLSQADAAAVVAAVQACRARCDELEAAINAVAWSGTEQTRAAACDAIQAINWTP